MSYQDFSQEILNILEKENADFQFFRHEPVFTKEEIFALANRFHFKGEEMKNLLLCDKKSRNFYLVLTLARKNRTNLEKVEELLNEKKLKMASPENVEKIAKAVPGCVSPFGFDDTIKIIADNEIFEPEFLLFSAGAPDNTIELASHDLRKILEKLPNEIIFSSL
ncbi:YbaK/EbsC family protein [Candidatus Gracilibacteria bacterium]|nr:YbaK/EbsC family protein [Candidatus Gracilibacteria bacterium]